MDHPRPNWAQLLIALTSLTACIGMPLLLLWLLVRAALAGPSVTVSPAPVPAPAAAGRAPRPDPRILSHAQRWRTSYTVADAIYRAARQEQVPVPLAFRLVQQESGFQPRAARVHDGVGLTQVLYTTARHVDPTVTRPALYNPHVNARIGLRYLRTMRRRYRGDWWRALIAYNQGPAVADTFSQSTHHYADRILGR
jgi:soluble lytic murein transglycosylase-like protein